MKRLLLVSAMTTLSFNTYAMKREYPFTLEKTPVSQQKKCYTTIITPEGGYSFAVAQSPTSQQRKYRTMLITTENAAEIAQLTNNKIIVRNSETTIDYYASMMLQLKNSQRQKAIPASQPIPAIIITPAPTQNKKYINNTNKQATPNKNLLQVPKRR